jgi:DNA-binding NarL/FixJ family response regulator
MHYLLTSRSFNTPQWESFFDGTVTAEDIHELASPENSIQGLWLCTAVDQWPSLVEQLSAAGINVAVLALAPSAEEAKSALSRGAKAYLQASASSELLRNAQTTLEAGGYWLPNELLLHLVDQFSNVLAEKQEETTDPRLASLTMREQEVCQLVARGHSNKVIANRLGITERTVKEHLSHSFAKLNVKDRMQIMLLVNGKLGEG